MTEARHERKLTDARDVPLEGEFGKDKFKDEADRDAAEVDETIRRFHSQAVERVDKHVKRAQRMHRLRVIFGFWAPFVIALFAFAVFFVSIAKPQLIDCLMARFRHLPQTEAGEAKESISPRDQMKRAASANVAARPAEQSPVLVRLAATSASVAATQPANAITETKVRPPEVCIGFFLH